MRSSQCSIDAEYDVAVMRTISDYQRLIFQSYWLSFPKVIKFRFPKNLKIAKGQSDVKYWKFTQANEIIVNKSIKSAFYNLKNECVQRHATSHPPFACLKFS